MRRWPGLTQSSVCHPDILHKDGIINRKILGSRVFGNKVNTSASIPSCYRPGVITQWTSLVWLRIRFHSSVPRYFLPRAGSASKGWQPLSIPSVLLRSS